MSTHCLKCSTTVSLTAKGKKHDYALCSACGYVHIIKQGVLASTDHIQDESIIYDAMTAFEKGYPITVKGYANNIYPAAPVRQKFAPKPIKKANIAMLGLALIPFILELKDLFKK